MTTMRLAAIIAIKAVASRPRSTPATGQYPMLSVRTR